MRADAAEKHDGEINATTLTLGIVVWPWLYVMQVGDSRYYLYAGGKLRQISRDQTVAQDLVEKGLLSAGQAHAVALQQHSLERDRRRHRRAGRHARRRARARKRVNSSAATA